MLYTMFLIGGIWLSLLYAAMVVPATIWQIQLTMSHGLWKGTRTAMAMALGLSIWALVASLGIFQFKEFWQTIDPGLRMGVAGFLLWMAWRVKGARPVESLHLGKGVLVPGFLAMTWRSLTMPWRLPLWMALLVSVSIHLRAPGVESALQFSAGTWIGLMLWYLHFMVITALFGHRVPESISLKSVNKFRVLSFTVLLGLGVLVLAPMVLL